MNKFTAVLVDDEEKANIVLSERLIEWAPEVRVLGMCESAEEAISSIIIQKPDLLFLDIEMKGMSGLELFSHLSEINKPPHCIIVTGRPETEHYREAKKLGVMEYVLKPLIKEEVVNAVRNTIERIGQNLVNQQLQHLLAITSTNKIVCPTLSGLICYRTHEVLCVLAARKETNFYLTNGTEQVVKWSITEAEQKMAGTSIRRIDRSHLVNMNYVKELGYYPPAVLLWCDGFSKTIPISNEGVKAVRKYLLQGHHTS